MGGGMSTLIEKLERERNVYMKKLKGVLTNIGLTRNKAKLEAIEKAINIVKQHSDWVSVDERLPEHGGTYPALADGRFGIAKFDPEYNAWLFKNFEVYELMANVTHWMPIPQPPSEVQP